VSPLEFLHEEIANVRRALDETLRYDYGPEQGREFYTECAARLAEIEKGLSSTRPSDLQTIRTRLNELQELSAWILLIERSHLGEFSWPFSDELKRIAIQLLSETDLKGDRTQPLIHVVAEGEGYQIVYESQMATASSRRPFVVVAFQRSLKHHALFHSIFGHELGHTALQTSSAGAVLNSEVIGAFVASGPLFDEASMNAWLTSTQGTKLLANSLARYQIQPGQRLVGDEDRESWLTELSCDLFGLVLFGPAFLAAHRTLLGQLYPDPYEIYFPGPTHPPYAVRHKMLRRVMELLGWNSPITNDEPERQLLSFLLDDQYDPWASVFDDAQLQRAIAGIQAIVSPLGSLAYAPVTPEVLRALVLRLENQLPPIVAELDEGGKPLLKKVAISQTLYAGRTYWIGRPKSVSSAALTFFETNRLCDLALLQQRAINDAIDAGIR
jgi:hypothetical protein